MRIEDPGVVAPKVGFMNRLEPTTKAQSVLQLLDLSVLVNVFIEMKMTRQTTETGFAE